MCFRLDQVIYIMLAQQTNKILASLHLVYISKNSYDRPVCNPNIQPVFKFETPGIGYSYVITIDLVLRSRSIYLSPDKCCDRDEDNIGFNLRSSDRSNGICPFALWWVKQQKRFHGDECCGIAIGQRYPYLTFLHNHPGGCITWNSTLF